MKHIAAIILAAGKGTRMKSTTKNKVALPVGDQPLVSRTVHTLNQLKLDQIIAVVGFAKDSVMEALGNQVEYAIQTKRLGTAHALKCGLSRLHPDIRTVISLYGDDSAFYPKNLFENIINHHRLTLAAVTFVTITKQNPTGLGRIVRAETGEVDAIIEEKNATSSQKKITEINTGLYCFNREFLEQGIRAIKKNAVSGEYYLTDIIHLARQRQLRIETVHWADNTVWHGVNTPEELAQAVARTTAI